MPRLVSRPPRGTHRHATTGAGANCSGFAIGGSPHGTVQLATYELDQSSGRHAHTGYTLCSCSRPADLYEDAAGGGRTVPVDIYVGGHVVYLAPNETAAPVEMAVTCMFAAGVSHASLRCLLSVPANCHFH